MATENGQVRGLENQPWAGGDQSSYISGSILSHFQKRISRTLARDERQSKSLSQLVLGESDTLVKFIEKSDFASASLCVERLAVNDLLDILPQIPIDKCIDDIPHSLIVLQVLYCKLLNDSTISDESADQIMRILHKDRLLLQFVHWLSTNSDMAQSAENNYYLYLRYCAEILRIIGTVEPQLGSAMRTLIGGLRRCVSGLGNHGTVQASTQLNVTLYDALKTEFQLLLTQLKTVVQKLEEDSNSKRTSSGLNEGGSTLLRKRHHHVAPVWASHQRMLQVTEDDVKQRLIDNKTLLIQLDPLVSDKSSLRRLVQILEQRVSCDKEVLLHFGDLKRNFPHLRSTSCLIAVFQQFICGFEKVAALLDGAQAEDVQRIRTISTPSSIDSLVDQGSDGDTVDTESSSRQSARSPAWSASNELLPTTSAVRSASPMTSQTNGHQAGIVGGGEGGSKSDEQWQEVTGLKAELARLQQQLAKSDDAVKLLQERERLLISRLSEQARHQFDHGSSKFEDLSLGSGRPSQLITRYGNLFSQGRVDAFDALDELVELTDFDDLKGKLLFSVVVLAFRCVQHTLQKLRATLHATLALPDRATASSQQLEDAVAMYLKRTTDERDLSHCTQEVCGQLWTTLYDYPSLKHCRGLITYIEECVRLAWALSVQTPPLVIEYDTWQFDDTKFTRFHSSNPDSVYVKAIVWPALLEGEGGVCVFKGIVIT